MYIYIQYIVRLSNHFVDNANKTVLFLSMFFSPPAPCVPRNAHGRLDCVTNSAWVTWDLSDGASSYVVLAEEAEGHNSSCSSASSPCNVPDLKCGTTYTFRVTAANQHCGSNHSETFEIETGMGGGGLGARCEKRENELKMRTSNTVLGGKTSLTQMLHYTDTDL